MRDDEARASNPGLDRHLQREDSALLDLRSPLRPSARLPLLIRRLLPDPMHEGGRRRWLHEDLSDLTAEDRRREAFQLAVAVALLEDPDLTPPWALERLARLRAA